MRFLLYFIVSIFLSFFIPFDLSAQKPGFIFQNLGLDDGLSEGTVRTIIEDKRGFMWFGTVDGLNKYDGYKFTIYKNIRSDKYSLSNSSIRGSYADSKNRLWIITRDGLNLYDPIKDRFYNYKCSVYPALADLRDRIEDISEDNKGNLWVVAGREGLFRIESLEMPTERFLPESKDDFGNLVVAKPDNKGNIWIGTWDGLMKFNIKNKQFIDLRLKYGRGYQVNHIHIDNTGNIWIATTQGLKIINKLTGELEEYKHDPLNYESLNGNNILKVIPYKDGNYLVAMDGTGIDYFDVKTKTFSHYTHENAQLSSNNITSFYSDSKGDLWAGTFLNGVNYSNSSTNLFALVMNNPYSDRAIKNGIITHFLKDSKSNFWITTDGGGLFIKMKGNETFNNYKLSQNEKGPSSDAIIDILEDEKGKIWLATYGGGLNLFNFKDSLFKTYWHDPLNPHSVCSNKLRGLARYNNKLWVGSYGTGISTLDEDSGKFKHYSHDKSDTTSILSDWIHKIFKDHEGNLWIGTFDGLCRYLPETDNFKSYRFDMNNKSADKNYINDIFEDSQGHLWIATGGGGLILFNSHTDTFEDYTIEDGLSNNTISSILEDDRSNLWLSTSNGLTKFNTASKRGVPYTIKDGAPSVTYFLASKYKDESGKLYFGTNKGYLLINPLMSAINKIIPPVVLTEIKLAHSVVHAGGKDSTLNKHISETKKISLSYDQNAFTIEFAALNFNNSKKNKYAFKLEGFDKAWNYVGDQRTATYTNLNPGSYIFRVRGSNNDEVWNKEGTFIEITIIPPLWLTWWFVTLEIIGSLIFLYLLYWFRSKSIRNKNLLLEKVVRRRTQELKESNDRLETFIYKASHDIKGPLKSIIGLTTVGEKDVSDPVALNYFQHILKSTKKLDLLLSDLLQLTKVKKVVLQKEKINFREMISEAMSSFENLPGYDKMKFNIEINQTSDFYSDKKLLSSIIQNLIENPIKYKDESKEFCKLNVKVIVKDGEAELIFADNGLGIPEEYQTRIFDMFFKVNDNSFGTGLGLYIVKTTIEKLEGSIRLESSAGVGSTFYIKFKRGNPPLAMK
jgi:ligand-binding sensor domain-containing protein/signal transduction histidine kinase